VEFSRRDGEWIFLPSPDKSIEEQTAKIAAATDPAETTVTLSLPHPPVLISLVRFFGPHLSG